MKIKSLVPWYGSKRTLAPRIIKQFGPHTTYVEPFAGSLAVLLAKEPARHEVVSDLHADLINLLRVLCDRESAERLHVFLSLVPYCETLYLEAVERLRSSIDSDPILRARDYMLASWQGINGLAGTDRKVTFARRSTASGGNGPIRWRGVCDSIPYWHERVNRVEFHQRDAFQTLEMIRDEPGTVVYCDPPYLSETRCDNAKYVHDFSAEDHQRLASALKRFTKARVVVSYYRNPTTDLIYDGWKCVDYIGRKNMSNVGVTPSKELNAQECVYVNGEIYPEA